MNRMDELEYEMEALSSPSPFQRFFRRKRFSVVLDSVKGLGLKKGSKILELGCGIGAHSMELARLGYDVTAVDINRKFIMHARAEAKKKGLKARFVLADASRELSLGKYDAVLTSEMLEHVPDFRKVMLNIEKSLKPGGFLVLTVPNHAGMGEFTEFLWSLQARFNWVEQHHGYVCSTKRLGRLISESGMRPLSMRTVFYISHFLPFLSEKLADFVFRKELRYLSGLGFGTIIVSVARR